MFVLKGEVTIGGLVWDQESGESVENEAQNAKIHQI